LRSKQKLAAHRRQTNELLNNEEKAKRIKDYMEREIAVARMLVEDAETAIEQEHKDMRSAESG